MLIRGDSRQIPLVNACVDCIVTSPPYFNQKDYGHEEQVGDEETVDEYVRNLALVFWEVWRVLKDSGTCWVNLGDSFRDKDLQLIPARVALRLQECGWYVRGDIIWHQPNATPESVQDRPTNAHEHVLLLTKSDRYWYDADAIREPLSDYYTERIVAGERRARPTGVENFSKERRRTEGLSNASTRAERLGFVNPLGRNKRDVWTIPTQSYEGAHFATMPEALVEPCILAGCPLGGLVLDPFVGSGTVGVVAARLARLWVGIDLSYQAIAQERTAQQGLRF